MKFGSLNIQAGTRTSKMCCQIGKKINIQNIENCLALLNIFMLKILDDWLSFTIGDEGGKLQI